MPHLQRAFAWRPAIPYAFPRLGSALNFDDIHARMSSARPVASPLFPRSALHPAALAWADAHAAVNAPWCVGFSGGADSLALLVALRQHFPRQKLVALHFNHHLRGADSDGDEQFCRETCAALGVEFHAGHWQHAPCADTNVSETEAREARHAFFDREMSALGASALWLGHQRDDIAETQLMRLARGSGSAGLAAPRPAHARAGGRVFLRPLLTLSKKEITGALRARGFIWREDATNLGGVGGDYFRNRIRRDVMPAWIAAAENDALAGAALTRELLDEDAFALDAWLDELLPPQAAAQTANCGGGQPPLDLRPLANKPRALLRRALRRWPPAADLARPGFESLLAICESPAGGQTSIGQNIAVFENGILRIDSAASSPSSFAAIPDFSFSAIPPFALELPDGAKLTAAQITLTDRLRAGILSGHYDPIHTIFIATPPAQTEFTIRSWRSGDRYHPLGAPGSAKVSDLFINRKIPHNRRLALPVVCIMRDKHSEILWVPGLPPADAWKINPKTQQALNLTYQCGTCTVSG